MQEQLNRIYVLVPLAYTHSTVQADLEKEISKLLKLPKDQFQISEYNNDYEDPDGHCRKFVMEVSRLSMSFFEIQELITDNKCLKERIRFLEETLAGYNPDEDLQMEVSQSANIDALVRKAKKAKQLKQQNKKLKKLLQLQLENTEKVREQTQKTMKTLKEQFDALVQEMNLRETKQNHYLNHHDIDRIENKQFKGSNQIVIIEEEVQNRRSQKQMIHHIKRELNY